jgi:hypothetical protein
MRAIVLIFPVLALAACAQPFQGRVASRLADAGFSRPMADCMAERWVNRLSLAQLQTISRVADDLARERAEGNLTVSRFIGRIRAVDDPELFTVVSSSAAACALTS